MDMDGEGFGFADSEVLACIDPSTELESYISDDTDCDDSNPDINPDAQEVCDPDNTDEDCDGLINDEQPGVLASTKTQWFADTDVDGFGDSDSYVLYCDAPTGYVADNTDCDDSEATTYPGADEYCDGHDDDCDGDVDEDSALDTATWYADADSDGYGDSAITDVECYQPTGYVADNTDCDDSDNTLNQDDNDIDGYSTCDGDCDDSDINLDPADNDNDGYSTCDGDCDDTDPTVALVCSGGQVRNTSGTWLDVTYEECGGSCTASDAKNACTAIGKRVVSHASNGTTSVASLGASTSCQWSISYFTVEATMPSTSCLVGISNLEWSGCCGTNQWHGNTIPFGSAGTTPFGYVHSSNSGYVSSYSNSSQSNWGCNSETSGASIPGSCTTPYVACSL